jgi:hypothetical protein
MMRRVTLIQMRTPAQGNARHTVQQPGAQDSSVAFNSG